MKAYVEGYAPIERPDHLRANWQDYGVSYSVDPSWTMSSRSEADGECARLNSIHVQVGEHHCEFEVEEVTHGDFAIICPLHPVLSKG